MAKLPGSTGTHSPDASCARTAPPSTSMRRTKSAASSTSRYAQSFPMRVAQRPSGARCTPWCRTASVRACSTSPPRCQKRPSLSRRSPLCSRIRCSVAGSTRRLYPPRRVSTRHATVRCPGEPPLPTPHRPSHASLTIRALRSRPVRVPMRRPLRTSGGTIDLAPMVLIDLETDQGVPGRAYLFAYSDAGARALDKLLAGIAGMIRGDAVAPVTVAKKLHARFTLLGREGLPTMAMSGVDIALWDALARAAAQPLARLLGGDLQPIPAYNSNGLGLDAPERVADEALELLAEGFHAVKLRLGRAAWADDLLAVRAVRKKIPADALLMTDFNQALTAAEALARGRALDSERICWIEEPVRHDDYAAAARIAREVQTPIQIGENFIGTRPMAAAIAAGAADYVMPDVGRIGGVTGWLRAAALADAAGLEMSSHLHPEVSAHLLAVTPTAHFVEYVDWAAPILQRPLRIADGLALP